MNRYDIILKELESNDFKKYDHLSFIRYLDKEDHLQHLMLKDTLNKIKKYIVSYVHDNYNTFDFEKDYTNIINSINNTNFFFKEGFTFNDNYLQTDFDIHFMPSVEDLKIHIEVIANAELNKIKFNKCQYNFNFSLTQ